LLVIVGYDVMSQAVSQLTPIVRWWPHSGEGFVVNLIDLRDIPLTH